MRIIILGPEGHGLRSKARLEGGRGGVGCGPRVAVLRAVSSVRRADRNYWPRCERQAA